MTKAMKAIGRSSKPSDLRGRSGRAPTPGMAGIPAFLAQQVVMRPVGDLLVDPRNARTHSDKQIHQLSCAIKEFGMIVPILIDEEGRMLAGHARLPAAMRAGLEVVPTLMVSGLTAEQRRAFVIADNRMAELAGWDKQALRREIVELIDLGFEVELTGFDTADIDLIIGTDGVPPDDLADDWLPDHVAGPAVSQRGDLWLLDEHSLLCGDALSHRDYMTLLGGEKVQLVFTDPPYNVPVHGHVSGLGATRHREFAMASGEMRTAEFIQFLSSVILLLAQFSQRAATLYVCMDWRHAYELLSAARGQLMQRNLCVWAKDNGGMGSLYRSQHELVFVFQNGPGKAINNVELGSKGRYRTNVWSYPGANSLHAERAEQLAMHPTVKPVALVADAILDCSHRGGLVLDPFAGSGTTILAAERTGRRARAIEIDPLYVDVAIRRWQDRTGQQAMLAGDGRSFAEVANMRQAGGSEAAIVGRDV